MVGGGSAELATGRGSGHTHCSSVSDKRSTSETAPRLQLEAEWEGGGGKRRALDMGDVQQFHHTHIHVLYSIPYGRASRLICDSKTELVNTCSSIAPPTDLCAC